MKFRLFILAIFSTLNWISCQSGAKEGKQADGSIYQKVDNATFKTLMQKKPGKLVDVRTPEEYAAGTISGAVNIDFKNDQFQENLKVLDKSTPVYVFCQAGGRSKAAAKIMQDQGFREIYELSTGYGGWTEK